MRKMCCMHQQPACTLRISLRHGAQLGTLPSSPTQRASVDSAAKASQTLPPVTAVYTNLPSSRVGHHRHRQHRYKRVETLVVSLLGTSWQRSKHYSTSNAHLASTTSGRSWSTTGLQGGTIGTEASPRTTIYRHTDREPSSIDETAVLILQFRVNRGRALLRDIIVHRTSKTHIFPLIFCHGGP